MSRSVLFALVLSIVGISQSASASEAPETVAGEIRAFFSPQNDPNSDDVLGTQGVQRHGFAWLKKRPCTILVEPNGTVSITSGGYRNEFVPYWATYNGTDDWLEVVSALRPMKPDGYTRDTLIMKRGKDGKRYVKVKTKFIFPGGASGNSVQRCSEN